MGNVANVEMLTFAPLSSGSVVRSSGLAPAAQDDMCKGQRVDLTRGRYLLFRRATRRYEKPCCASFFPSTSCSGAYSPSMPTERSRFLTTQRKSVILGKWNAKHNTSSAELSGFVRLAILRKNTTRKTGV